jgi:aspartate/glutamate racemase
MTKLAEKTCKRFLEKKASKSQLLSTSFTTNSQIYKLLYRLICRCVKKKLLGHIIGAKYSCADHKIYDS